MTSWRDQPLSRRDAIRLGVGAAGGVLLGCAFGPDLTPRGSPRLSARPHTPSGTATPGLPVNFELEPGQNMILYVPSGYQSSVPAPLVLMYHGAGGSAQGPINLFQPWADSAGIILVALNSYNSTWDGLIGEFGPDIRLSDAALAKAFDLCAVDASRVSVEGFSDGASYALAIGRANGDLFSRVAAFSPGIFLPVHTTGTPQFYISHASNDPVLPVENTRKMVLVLRQSYEVTYREFSGGHFVPADIAEEGERWLAAPR
jgi:phospholipase/carboxylesterase